MGKKVLRILLVIVSILLILFSVLKLTGLLNSDRDYSTKGTIGFGNSIGAWSREIGSEKFVFNIEVYDDDSIYIELKLPEHSDYASCNGFYYKDAVINCNYNSEVIQWDLQSVEKEDCFATVVPDDCKGAYIDDVFYEAENINIEADGDTVQLRIVAVSVAHKEDHQVFLMDKKDKSHQEPKDQ